MHTFDWNDLRYFLAVCREGTLAGAARYLRVQHTTVGRRLEVLENGLGASLFNRTPDGFVLTAAGARMLPLAEEAERALTAIERGIAGVDQRIEGVVRVTTSEAFSGFIVRRLGELHERHPELVVEVLAGNRSFDLSRGEADIALRIADTKQPDLICRRIGDAGWSLYASESYVQRRGAPLADDIGGHDVIVFEETMANIPGAVWLTEHAAGTKVMLRANSIIAALNGTIFGMGLAVLPCFLADAEPTLRRLTPDVLGSRPLWLVFHPDVAQIARVRCVIDFLVEIVGAEAGRLEGTPTPS